MLENLKYDGDWWLPVSPEKKIRGTLYFSPNTEIVLELLGSYKGNELIISDVILGSTIDGKKITLTRCMQFDYNRYDPGGETSKFIISEIFLGEHFSSLDNIEFNKISVSFSYLNEWAGFKTFKTDLTKDGETIITHKNLKPIEVKINDNLKLILHAASRNSSYLTKYCVGDETYFIVIFSKKLSFYECRRYIHILQNFLTLAVGDDVSYPLKLSGSLENGEKITKVDIYYKIADIKESTKIRQHMLFNYDVIIDNFDSFIKNWFKYYQHDSLETAFNIYFGTIFNERLYVDNQFLNYMIAIESLHRSLYSSKYVSDEDYDKIKNELIKTIEKISDKLKAHGFKPSIITKLNFLHEFSLAKRLKEICKEYEDIIGDIIGDKELFISITKDTRNYLIHNDPKSKGSACDGKDLIILNAKLRILLEVCILHAIGFSNTEIKSMFARFERYQKKFIDNSSRIV